MGDASLAGNDGRRRHAREIAMGLQRLGPDVVVTEQIAVIGPS
jgi:hypothetical protein